MNVSFKRDMTHNYMVPELTESVCEDDYRIHMLMENHIRGLLPCSMKRVNCQNRFFYDITSRQSMEHIYSNNRLGAEDIRVLLRGLYRALREVKKYLLEIERIILEPQMIYMDIETREPLFCYLPGYQKDILQSFRELTAYILEHLDQTDSQAVLLGYEIYRKAREENYSLEKILQEAGRPQEMSQEWEAGRPQETGREWEAGRPQETGREWEAGRAREPQRYRTPQSRQSVQNYREPQSRQSVQNYRAPQSRQSVQNYRERQNPSIQEGDTDFEEFARTGAEPEEEYPSAEKKRKKKMHGGKKEKKKAARAGKNQERQERPPEKKAFVGHMFLVGCFLFAVVLLLAAAYLWGLSLTQIGGVIFLLVGILIYGFSSDEKKKKGKNRREEKQLRKALEEFEEEPYYEEKANVGEESFLAGEPYRGESFLAGAPRRGELLRENQPRRSAPAYADAWDAKQPTRFAEDIKYHTGPVYTKQEKTHADRLGDTGVLYEEEDYAPRLVLVGMNPGQRDSIVLEEDCYTFGKLSSQCDIVLDHPSVSRVHAKLERHGKDYYLCDLNSTNGTFVNGNRLMVNERVRVQPGDEIAFARVGFYVGRC